MYPPEKEIRKYFSVKIPQALEKQIFRKHALNLLFLILDLKPGASVYIEDKTLMENMVNDFSLFSRENPGSPSLLICKEEERFDTLEKTSSGLYSDKSLGKFFGYPNNAVEYHSKHPIEHQAKEKVEFLKNEEKINEEEFRLLNLLSYVPEPEEKEISNAIEEARRRKKSILTLDTRLEVEYTERYVEPLEKTPFYCR